MKVNQVYFEDCLEGMKNIPDGAVDMVLTDLPYGVLKSGRNAHTKWDVVIPPEKLWEHWKRICKPNAPIVLTATQPFATDLINSNRSWFRYELIWAKSRASGFLNARKMPSRAHENVLIFYDKPPVYNPQKYLLGKGYKKRTLAKKVSNSKAFKINMRDDYRYVDDGSRFPDTLLEFTSVSRKGMHPTEKPVELFRWLIKAYTEPGALVLDCCMGSGTTAVAAILEGRNYIGYEMEKRYFEMTQKRIFAAQK